MRRLIEDDSYYVVSMFPSGQTYQATGEQMRMLEAFGFLFQILGTLGLTWAGLVLYILIKNGHLKNNVAYIPAAGLAAANVGQLILLVGHLSPALYAYSIHGTPEDPCDGVFIVLWYGSLGNVLLMAVSRCWVTWRPTQAKYFFTFSRMIICSVSGFVLGICVAALPYLDVCCHFAFQVSSAVIDEDVAPPIESTSNESFQSILSVNYSVVVPNSDHEYLAIIKTNNVLLLTHVIDFFTVFVSIICYALVFCRVRQHGNKISAQQQHRSSPHSSPISPNQLPKFHSVRRIGDQAGTSQVPPYRLPRQFHHQGTSRMITSTSDVRMLRRISVHFCLMSSAVMFFSVILLIVHRYPNEPALVLLHQLFYIITATVNSFLISTLNEKIRSDFRKTLCQFKLCCCKPQTTTTQTGVGSRFCCCTAGDTGAGQGRSNEGAMQTSRTAAPMITLDLAQR